MTALLAHQGGWDEIVLVLGPIAVVVVLLAVARSRLEARRPPPASTDADDDVADSDRGTTGRDAG
jgi:hypothetical protein